MKSRCGLFIAAAAAVVFVVSGMHAATVTYDGMLPLKSSSNWATIAEGVPVLDFVTPVSCKSGGGYIGVNYSDAYFVTRSGDSIFFECQVYAGGYIKCVMGELQIQDGKLVARTVSAGLKTNPGDLRAGSMSMVNYGNSTATDQPGGGGYGISSVTLDIVPLEQSVMVSGAPFEYGVPAPAYGTHEGYVDDAAVINATCPASWTSTDESLSASCTGWKLYRYLADNDGKYDWQFWLAGTGASVSDIAHPGVFTKLEWQWAPNYICTATATEGGSVNLSSQTLPFGGTFTVTATPVSGDWVFAGWTGDVPHGQRFDNPLSLTVDGILGVTATFSEKGVERNWTGAGEDALASNPANWEGGAAPMAMQVVVLDSGSKDMTWDLDIPLGGWRQDGYTGTVTIPTVFPDAGLGDFTCLNVFGDVTLNSGTWTHLDNIHEKEYRLSVKVSGDMTVGADATIHADDLGYWASGDGGHAKGNGTSGGCYGGHGGFNAGNVNYTYGSYAAPADDLGGGGCWKSTYNLAGGGAIKLDVGGAFVHNGSIRANSISHSYEGGVYYLGSGGGIEVIAGSIEGAGTLKANSHGSTATGGGGRIAVKLTDAGADFSNYDIVNLAQAVAGQNSTGAPGTIYAETAADESGQGWLIFKGNGSDPQANELTNADPFIYTNGVQRLHFAKMTFTNNVMALVREGNILDLRDCEIVAADIPGRKNGIRLNGGEILFEEGDTAVDLVACRIDCLTAPAFPGGTLKAVPFGDLRLPKSEGCSYSNDIVLDGGRIVMPNAVSLSGDVTVKAGGELFVDTLLDIDGEITVENGGLVTHEGPQQVATYKCEIHTTGDFTIDAGGKVAPTGMGFSHGYGNTGFFSSASGASHGGQGYAQNMNGDSAHKPFGSVREPQTAGSGAGGNSGLGAGGGVVKLVVGGTLTNNGEISAKGANDNYYAGAGGTVSITATEIAGAGVIDASAGNETSWGTPTQSGGGRVAIRLTGANADFSSFAVTNVTAYGTFKDNGFGGAGTIYLVKEGESLADGVLIIRNGSQSVAQNKINVTPVGGDVTDTEFGDVVIGVNGKFKVADNATITVNGDWLNGSYYVAGQNSTVAFAGAEISTVTGNSEFASLSCVTPGKTIMFDSGTRQTVSTLLNISGTSAAHVAMRSVTDGEAWELDATGGVSLSCVDFKDCHSITPLTVVNGTDLGGNENITFISVSPGEKMTWTGAVGSNWGTPGNWDRNRFPVYSDVVVIPAGCANFPAMAGDSSVAELTVASGASLDVGGFSLSVTGDATFAGEVSMMASGSVTIRGDADLGGTWSGVGAKIVSQGDGGRAIAVSSASKMPAIVLDGGEVAFSGSLKGECLSVTAGTEAQFASGATLAVDYFTVTGTADAPATLSGAGTWDLGASKASVSHVAVSACDASQGVLIVADADSVDGGGNVNWMFGDTRLRWNGDPGDYSGYDAIIDGGAVTLAAGDAATFKSLAVADGATLTVNGELSTTGAVTIGDGGTVVWNAPGEIGGNLTMLDGAVLTHDAGGSKRIDLTVGGAGLIESGAKIDAKGKGYRQNYSPAGYIGGNWGGTHGGRGYGGDTTPETCYGSISCPTNCGASSGNNQWGSAGGGAVKLAFAGALQMDGEINVDGAYKASTFYTGAGGSIWITATTMTGSGNILASGGETTGQQGWGGGGRISVVLTDTTANLDGFTGRIEAFGGHTLSRTLGSSGTVWTKFGNGPGTVKIANKADLSFSSKWDFTDFPPSRFCDPGDALGCDVVIGTKGSLNLTRDYKVRSISLEGSDQRILLNGHVLKVATRPPSREDKLLIESKVIKGDTGRIVWPNGTMLTLR